jgi:hypothetical protein
MVSPDIEPYRNMTRKTWLVFATVQILGCLAYLRALKLLYADPLHHSFGRSLLFLTHRWLAMPGNIVAGLLLSTFHVESVAAWRFGYLSLAVLLNAGFWWLCVAAVRAAREHLLGIKPHRYALTFAIAALVFIIVNIADFHLRPAMCADCFYPHGLPFNLWHEGGFAGGEAIMWGGLAADTLIVAVAATAAGTTWKWWSGRRT